MGIPTTPRTAKVPDVSAAMELRATPTGILKRGKPRKYLEKYYAQRYRLFHLFDEGVVLDEESWYSVTPEKIALHIAERFSGRDIILDLFSGAGGNSIQFALAGAYVIAVESSSEKIKIAAHNATVYGVRQYIEFIQGDVYEILPTIRSAAISGIFLSPPWGGPNYKQQGFYDVEVFSDLVNASKCVSSDIGILLPRNVDPDNILKHFGPCEVERNYLDHKLKTVTVYFGELVQDRGGVSHQEGSDVSVADEEYDGLA